MRNLRPLFEDYVNKNDVQQRRTLRSAAAASRQEPEDAFEDYLTLMSQNGTYGGEPELVAFCQVFDQDVTVHLPRIRNFNQDHLFYKNEHRGQAPAPAPLWTSAMVEMRLHEHITTRLEPERNRSHEAGTTPVSSLLLFLTKWQPSRPTQVLYRVSVIDKSETTRLTFHPNSCTMYPTTKIPTTSSSGGRNHSYRSTAESEPRPSPPLNEAPVQRDH